MNYKKLFAAAFLLWLGAFSQADAQILNDSSDAIYGSATTMIIREANIFKGNLTPTRIDTSLTNLPSFRYWYYDTTLMQNLGNVGTASQPMFWRMPTQLGNRLGRDAFDPYSVNPATLEYYDTKSPFTFLNYVQGAQGEQIFRAKHTRNVSANWNVGIGYERVGAERQMGSFNPARNGLISHYGLLAFTHYFSKNERYRIMANYSQTSHEQIELGGVRPEGRDSIAEFFDYPRQAIWLQQAASEEKRNDFHATQWYKLIGQGLQLYHTVDVNNQHNEYSDTQVQFMGTGANLRPVFYPRVRLDSTRTYDDTYFTQVENTFGVMGSTRLFVYRAYAKRRDGAYESTAEGVREQRGVVNDDTLVYYVDRAKRTIADNFIGGEAQFRLKNDIYVTTDAELQIGGGDYRINAQARYKYLSFRQTRMSYTPTLLQRTFISNHFEWNNDFENTQANQTAVAAEIGIKNHYLNAQLQFTNLRNYVYYQDSVGSTGSIRSANWATPAQENGNVNLVQANMRYRFTVKSFVFDNNVYFNRVTGNDVIRMPEWYIHSKAYVQGPLFKRAIYVQAGLEVNWHTDYYAEGYMPVTQQFHLQNRFLVSRYPTLDVFLNTDIKTVNLFLKLNNLNNVTQSWEPGYFTTPYYVANPFSFVFGLQWNFYD